MVEVGAGAAEDTDVEDMVMDMVVDVVAKEDVEEGDMVINHMNLQADMEHSWPRPLYILQTNGDSSPCNKILIFKK